jgi:glutamate--cysteine ligase
MRQGVRTLGLKTPVPGGRSMQDLAVDVLDIARAGLKRRANLSVSGDDETGYLSELDQIARSGLTPAERLLEKYHGEWQRDLSHIFADQAY